MEILLFAGTADGRVFAEGLAAMPRVQATLCVATDYGREVLADLPRRFPVLAGRLDAAKMEGLLAGGRFALAVDATHPYATVASDNIRAAAARSGTPYLRLSRAEGDATAGIRVDTAAEAAKRVAAMPGNVLAAIGAKELDALIVIPDYAVRVFPRVLPIEESIRRCEELGFRRSHIIAMQGPFGRELNLAIMRQYDIRILVTKDGGAEGGFPEKMAAAGEAGVDAIVIGRPPKEKGVGLEEALAKVAAMAEGEK